MGASPPPRSPPVDSSLNAALDRQTRLARRVRSQAHATAPRALFWRVSCAFAIVALLAALSSRNASSFGSGARRGLDGAATLPFGAGSADAGDVGPTWTTQRLLRHFGADVAAQVRFTALDASKPPDAILAAMRDLVATTEVAAPPTKTKTKTRRARSRSTSRRSRSRTARTAATGPSAAGPGASGSPPAWASRPRASPSSATPPTTARRRRQRTTCFRSRSSSASGPPRSPPAVPRSSAPSPV